MRIAWILLASTCFAANPPAVVMNHSVRVEHDFSYAPLPYFRGGYLVTREHETNFAVWDRSGKLISEGPLSLPGAIIQHLLDAAAVSRGDRLAFTASISDGSSRLIWTTLQGQIVASITTSPFVTRKIIFASDGTLWAFGGVYASSSLGESEYDCLRHYDTAGKLIGSALPRSTFSPGRMSPAEDSFLTAGDDRIGVVSLTSQEYVEISLTGQVLGRWKIPNLSPKIVTGATLLSDNQFYVSYDANLPGRSVVAKLCRLNKTTGVLEEVDTGKLYDSSPSWFYILGSDGKELVLRVKPAGVMAWVGVTGGSE